MYALPEQQYSVWLDVARGTTASQALLRSGFIERFSGVSLDSPVGVYGELVDAEQALRDGDRLEIYRPLLVDPMQARRVRAVRQKQ